MTTRVYQYGVGKPLTQQGLDLVREQMRLAHKYRNTLVEIERLRRNAVRLLIDDAQCLELKAAAVRADEQCRLEAKAVKERRSRARSQDVPSDLLAAAREARNVAVRALEKARRLRQKEPSVAAEIEHIKTVIEGVIRNARHYCGLYWGTYQLVEEAAGQSFMSEDGRPLWIPPPKSHQRPRDGIGIEPNNPRFLRWTGEGSVSVQFQMKGGMPVGTVLNGADQQLRLVPADARWPQITHSRKGVALPPPGPKQIAKRYVLSIRIKSDEKKNPIWVDLPCMLDRPLPTDGTIARATIHCRREGPRERWSLDVQVNEPARAPTHGIGTVAIDVGWRRMDDGEIRVAAWGDDLGNSGEVRLSVEDLRQLHWADALQRVRAKNFNSVREGLLAWMARQTNLPAWLASATETLANWRSEGRLAALVIRWRNARDGIAWNDWRTNTVAIEKVPDGSDEIFATLEAWRKQDKHLWDYASGQRSGAIGRRNDWFRRWADWFAKTYDTVIIEDFDKRQVALKPDLTEVEDEQSERARANRQRVAVSILCSSVKNATQRRGGVFVMENPKHTTHDCAIVTLAHGIVCGERNVFDQAKDLTCTCSGCGVTWDQDENAWKNLIRRWKTNGPVTTSPSRIARNGKRPNPNARVGEKRWDRVRRLKAEKEAKDEVARKLLEDAAE